MSSPRVAVVVPCFNDGATLPETLASLGSQEPHELAVVDDGSDDPETLAVLDRLRADGVRIVRQENGGLAAARMAGVAATSAPYVLPLDADDALAPAAIGRLADALDSQPRAMLAWGDVEIFGSFSFTVATAEHLDPWYVTYLLEAPPTPLVRRTALERSGGWRLRDAYEDWDFYLRFAELGFDGVRVPATVIRYRRAEPRMNAGALARHGELLALLRTRHEQLFAARAANRRRSDAPLRARILFPLIERLPVGALDRHRLLRLVAHPGQVLRARRARIRARAAA